MMTSTKTHPNDAQPQTLSDWLTESFLDLVKSLQAAAARPEELEVVFRFDTECRADDLVARLNSQLPRGWSCAALDRAPTFSAASELNRGSDKGVLICARHSALQLNLI